MGRIVTGGRRVEVNRATEKVIMHRKDENVPLSPGKVYRSRHMNLKITDGNAGAFSSGVRGKKIPVAMRNLDTVREHFAVNVSDALCIALQLTAKAIREGRMTP